jgi:hypothetical protein
VYSALFGEVQSLISNSDARTCWVGNLLEEA